MSSILSTMLMSASAMATFEQALQVTQNNVANASTPGYVEQNQILVAQSFNPQAGIPGGVTAGEVASARNEFAEQAVQQQTNILGAANQNVSSLTSLQTSFDVTGSTGITYALNNLFQAFSAWGQTPGDGNARQNIIDQATSVAQAFRDTASGLNTITRNTNQQLQQTVNQVNQLVGQLQQLSVRAMQGDNADPGLDAQQHADLEQLSSYVPFTATRQADGSVTILLNGQTPLLMGSQQYPITFNLQQTPDATYPNGPPLAHILASNGDDITSGITTGQLGALLQVRNQVLPSYIGSGVQAGDLNTMAKQFADTVNALLQSGTQSDGVTPGVALFTYASQGGTDPTRDDTSAAQTIAVNSAITAGQLAAGSSSQSNGIALALSELANPQNAGQQINGESFTEFYGDLAARVGSALSAATSQQSVSQSAVAQAQNLRQQTSGVDLNAEAMKAVEFERAYEANARLISVLNQLTADEINILSSSA